MFWSQNMRLLNRFYNEDKFRQNVEEALEVVDFNECQSWLKHPCTQALKNAIQADMCGILNVWLGAGYADETSVDATAQREAKARGMAQALDDMLETIEFLGYRELKGDNYDTSSGPQTTS